MNATLCALLRISVDLNSIPVQDDEVLETMLLEISRKVDEAIRIERGVYDVCLENKEASDETE